MSGLALALTLALAAPSFAVAANAKALAVDASLHAGALEGGTTTMFAVTTLAVAAPSIEFRVPKNDGWVTDLADLLSSADESALEARLEEWKQRTGHQIAVLTVPTLGDASLEETTLAVARAWAVGTAERKDGALLFVAQGDRKLRIEVGTGLEGALTDSISGRIIRDVIAPKFRSKDFSTGVRAGVEAMIGVVEGGVDSVPALQGKKKGAAVGGAVLVMFILMLVIFSIAKRMQGGGRGRGGGGLGPFLAGSILGHGLGGGFGGRRGGGFSGGGGGGFSGFGGGGFSGGGASGGW